MKEAFQTLLSFLEQSNFPKTSKVLKEEMGIIIVVKIDICFIFRNKFKEL